MEKKDVFRQPTKLYSSADFINVHLTCPDCGVPANSVPDLKEHCEKFHSCVAFCIPCVKPFISLTGYSYHQRMHIGGTSCDICGQIVQSEAHLKRHKLKHSTDREFACPGCRKFFKLKFNMKTHMKGCVYMNNMYK